MLDGATCKYFFRRGKCRETLLWIHPGRWLKRTLCCCRVFIRVRWRGVLGWLSLPQCAGWGTQDTFNEIRDGLQVMSMCSWTTPLFSQQVSAWHSVLSISYLKSFNRTESQFHGLTPKESFIWPLSFTHSLLWAPESFVDPCVWPLCLWAPPPSILSHVDGRVLFIYARSLVVEAL